MSQLKHAPALLEIELFQSHSIPDGSLKIDVRV
jgi:hypothetical protein